MQVVSSVLGFFSPEEDDIVSWKVVTYDAFSLGAARVSKVSCVSDSTKEGLEVVVVLSMEVSLALVEEMTAVN